jgi:hypothetical protein
MSLMRLLNAEAGAGDAGTCVLLWKEADLLVCPVFPDCDCETAENLRRLRSDTKNGTIVPCVTACPQRLWRPRRPSHTTERCLRYHARGMDAAQQADTSEEPIDEYLLQIWPEPSNAPAVLKRTSDAARYWMDHAAQA